ncbi:6-phosphogluconolactonase, cycloisomerase 2 family [Friedmanniella luteola]|uniref:6-phosphogluconolactonase, cycloisomerase 2 family n=1 Tax=Friedmanniella luteola TaxID=546871 RepID=A0A1H1PU99_9ACTN|nr:beta-propeller fold lactonase family protein [Friedmanniella luteola]SDS14750.1 6-phosphogluconolactonase, cycloisomerase 2 family [Friedmanniella luteola]
MQPEVGTPLPGQVVIGGYTADGDEDAVGLTSWRPRPDGAGLAEVGRLALADPTYLVAHPTRPWLFVAGESDPGQVSSVALGADGSLTLLSTVPTGGSGSCHLALAADGRHVVVADYGSGTVCSVPVGADGRLGERTGFWRFAGSGPDPGRQEAPHAHQVVVVGDELLVADLGTDRVHRLRLSADGDLAEAGPAVPLPAGSGPRHLVVVEDHLVVAAELSGELWLGRRASDGGWTELDRVPCTAHPAGGELYPSALRADGDTVVVANRGPGTVATFALDRVAGTLRLVDERSGGGRWPRDLVVGDALLWVANQTDDVVTVLARDADPGAEPVLTVRSQAPACVVLVPAAGR